ncbi:MAG TPA: TIGR00730 family Rossman fold protein [Solirubrobacterales bacterium]
MSPSSTDRICVFAGSDDGNRPEYREAASALGRELAERGIGLVYGGSGRGLMGAAADAALAAGGEAIGVIPEALLGLETSHRGLTELHIVGSMHERKAKMADLSRAFIALSGGIGTLKELLEVTTWSILGIHTKPAGCSTSAATTTRSARCSTPP